MAEPRKDMKVHACLPTEPMGDQAAFDYVQGGHCGRLRHEGLLDASSSVQGHRAVLASSWDGLCIDEYFTCDRVPIWS